MGFETRLARRRKNERIKFEVTLWDLKLCLKVTT